jgi:hypothetical protein
MAGTHDMRSSLWAYGTWLVSLALSAFARYLSICGGAFETRHAMIWAVLTLLRAPGGLPWQGTGHQ